MIGQRELTVEDYKSILRRRIWVLVLPVVLLSAGAYVVSLFLPARFKSETIILVEGPAVDPAIVKPIAGGDPNQRLATMREEILSRTRLQQIVEKFDLYRDEVNRRPMEELVARLRSTIDVSAVRPMDRTNANGLPGFTIGVTAGQSQLAQHICTEITSMFLQQSVIYTEQKATDQTDFLTRELEEAKGKLDDQDQKLAEFQKRNAGTLPEEAQTNFSLLSGLASQLDSETQALNRDQQNKLLLESALSQQIASAKLSQTASNPDTLSRQIAALQEQLATLRLRYTDDHPDVAKLRNEISRLQQKVHDESAPASQTASSADATGPTVDTPAIQQLRAQLRQIDFTIKDRVDRQAKLQQQISRVQGKLEMAPAVQQQYKALTRDYQTALNIYNELLKKQSDSEMSRQLIRRQQGEQFRVLDPPSLPQEPTFPNRKLFALGGLAGGLGIGLTIAFLLESQDTTLRTDRDIELLLKLPVLALIPATEIIKGSRTKDRGDLFDARGLGSPADSAKRNVGV
jgi:polysaccharide chain length determinant protein (PEP-CTERM system associated)